MSEVAVLGCGPAGMFATEAVVQAGHTPTIFSRKIRSVIPGSQYLHEGIPGLTPQYPDNCVQYVRMGTPEGYAKKVYGDEKRRTGWEAYSMLYPSWNVVNAYDKAWERYENLIENATVDQGFLKEIVNQFDLVITTLPAPVLCNDGAHHHFAGTPFWIKTLPVPYADRNKDIVIYNGLETDHWYRWSILSGVCSIESTSPPPEWLEDDTVLEGRKAETTNCDCWEGVVRAGRWAEWQHGVLLHDAFRTAEIEVARRLG